MTKEELKVLFAHCSTLTETEFYALIDFIGGGSSVSTTLDLDVVITDETFDVTDTEEPNIEVTAPTTAPSTPIPYRVAEIVGATPTTPLTILNSSGYDIEFISGNNIKLAENVLLKTGKAIAFMVDENGDVTTAQPNDLMQLWDFDKYDDWYLPSVDELLQVFTALGDTEANRTKYNIDYKYLWSSTQSVGGGSEEYYAKIVQAQNNDGSVKIPAVETDVQKNDAEFIETRPIRDFRSTSTIAIGTYTQGGYVFYKDTDFYGAGDHKYFVVSLRNTETKYDWGAFGVDVTGTADEIGEGKANTILINTALDLIPETDKASQICTALREGQNAELLKPIKPFSASNLSEGGATLTFNMIDPSDMNEYTLVFINGIFISKTLTTS